MKHSIVIPARYKSSRFPGKPLAKINNKEMIIYVGEICAEAIGKDNVYIATDDEKIKNVCIGYRMNVIMTSENCLTGSDRIYEASLKIDSDVLINVQGDEPLIKKEDILKVVEHSKKNPDAIVNAMCPIRDKKEFFSLNVPKVVIDSNNKLLYMSRAGIPHNKVGKFAKAYKQVCIYAFPKEPLSVFYNYAKKTPLESIEDIEILRFLELGYEVNMVEVGESSISVDLPQDIARVERALNENQGFTKI